MNERTVITPQKGPLAGASQTGIILSVRVAFSCSLASGLRVNKRGFLSGPPGSDRPEERHAGRGLANGWMFDQTLTHVKALITGGELGCAVVAGALAAVELDVL